MVKHIWSGVLLLVFSLLTGSQALGQVTTATISGTVSDSTGAVIPGATVTVRNVETGISRTVTTSTEGRYAALQLGLGGYVVTAETAGFQTMVRAGITLTVGREAVVNMTMQVGAVAETVTVTGEAPLVETTNSAVTSLVEGGTIREIPLNGRSFDQLVLLQPGVFLARPAAGGVPGFAQSTAWFSVAGSRPTQSITLLDGTNINSFFYRAGSGVGGRNLGVDAIREFRLLTNNYSAEYGRTNGAVINVVTRSGGNALHGSAFEFLRNAALDAKNFFDDPNEPTPHFVRNQFGGSIGGPIVQDRTFFFGVYEGLRDRLGVTRVAFIPSMAARQGILPNKTVTVDPVVEPFLALFPVPNGPEIGGGVQQHTTSATQPTTQNFFQVRLDHQLSDNHSLFGRYTQDRGNMSDPYNSSPLPDFGGPKTADSASYFTTLQWTAILSPTLLNSFRFSNTRIGHQGNGAEEPEILRFVPEYKRIGLINIGGVGRFGTGSFANNTDTLRNSFQFSDDVTISRGDHTIKIGALHERFRDRWFYEYLVTGEYTFATLETFLDNDARTFRGAIPGADPRANWRQSLYAFYLQDDWRLNQRLTLNLGIRYEFQTQATNARERFDGLFGVVEDPVNDVCCSVVKHPFRDNPTLGNIAPRFGIAWDVFGNGQTAVRGGFGIAYEPVLAHLFTFWTQFQPLTTNVVTFSPPFPNPFVNGIPSSPIVSSVDEPNDYNATAGPSTMQFNLNVQHQLPGQIALQIGYVGSLGRHLGLGRDANYADSVILPNGRYFVPPENFGKRHNPNFGNLGLRYFEANSSYSSLQISAQKALSSGFAMSANYTWSKSMDDSSNIRIGEAGGNRRQDISNPACVACDRGLSDFDRRHVFNTTYTYELPIGPNRAIGGNLTGVGAKLLGGWEVSGIVTLNSGLPTSASSFFDRAAGLAASIFTPVRPELVAGRSNNPTSGVSVGCLGVPAGQKLGDPARWFDPCSFEVQPAGFFGNAGRNTIIGPGLTNFDISFVKNTRWGESNNMQFRAEFFNIFNHPNFFEPNPNVFASPSNFHLPIAGRITTTANTSRQIQFGLKFTF